MSVCTKAVQAYPAPPQCSGLLAAAATQKLHTPLKLDTIDQKPDITRGKAADVQWQQTHKVTCDRCREVDRKTADALHTFALAEPCVPVAVTAPSGCHVAFGKEMLMPAPGRNLMSHMYLFLRQLREGVVSHLR